MPQKSTSKASRWHKNNEPAQFIVRQILSGKISLKEPDFAKFVRDNPSFGKANDKNLRRNFKIQLIVGEILVKVVKVSNLK